MPRPFETRSARPKDYLGAAAKFPGSRGRVRNRVQQLRRPETPLSRHRTHTSGQERLQGSIVLSHRGAAVSRIAEAPLPPPTAVYLEAKPGQEEAGRLHC